MKKIFIIVFLSLLCGRASTAIAQVGIKTNLLGWTTASPNLSLEWGIGKKSTLNISGSFNPFRFSDGKQSTAIGSARSSTDTFLVFMCSAVSITWRR